MSLCSIAFVLQIPLLANGALLIESSVLPGLEGSVPLHTGQVQDDVQSFQKSIILDSILRSGPAQTQQAVRSTREDDKRVLATSISQLTLFANQKTRVNPSLKPTRGRAGYVVMSAHKNNDSLFNLSRAKPFKQNTVTLLNNEHVLNRLSPKTINDGEHHSLSSFSDWQQDQHPVHNEVINIRKRSDSHVGETRLLPESEMVENRNVKAEDDLSVISDNTHIDPHTAQPGGHERGSDNLQNDVRNELQRNGRDPLIHELPAHNVRESTGRNIVSTATNPTTTLVEPVVNLPPRIGHSLSTEVSAASINVANQETPRDHTLSRGPRQVSSPETIIPLIPVKVEENTHVTNAEMVGSNPITNLSEIGTDPDDTPDSNLNLEHHDKMNSEFPEENPENQSIHLIEPFAHSDVLDSSISPSDHLPASEYSSLPISSPHRITRANDISGHGSASMNTFSTSGLTTSLTTSSVVDGPAVLLSPGQTSDLSEKNDNEDVENHHQNVHDANHIHHINNLIPGPLNNHLNNPVLVNQTTLTSHLLIPVPDEPANVNTNLSTTRSVESNTYRVTMAPVLPVPVANPPNVSTSQHVVHAGEGSMLAEHISTTNMQNTARTWSSMENTARTWSSMENTARTWSSMENTTNTRAHPSSTFARTFSMHASTSERSRTDSTHPNTLFPNLFSSDTAGSTFSPTGINLLLTQYNTVSHNILTSSKAEDSVITTRPHLEIDHEAEYDSNKETSSEDHSPTSSTTELMSEPSFTIFSHSADVLSVSQDYTHSSLNPSEEGLPKPNEDIDTLNTDNSSELMVTTSTKIVKTTDFVNSSTPEAHEPVQNATSSTQYYLKYSSTENYLITSNSQNVDSETLSDYSTTESLNKFTEGGQDNLHTPESQSQETHNPGGESPEEQIGQDHGSADDNVKVESTLATSSSTVTDSTTSTHIETGQQLKTNLVDILTSGTSTSQISYTSSSETDVDKPSPDDVISTGITHQLPHSQSTTRTTSYHSTQSSLIARSIHSVVMSTLGSTDHLENRIQGTVTNHEGGRISENHSRPKENYTRNQSENNNHIPARSSQPSTSTSPSTSADVSSTLLSILPSRPVFPVYVDIRLQMTWLDFCDHQQMFCYDLLDILRRHGQESSAISVDQVRMMDSALKTCAREEPEVAAMLEEEITVQLYMVNKTHHYDFSLTIICAQILKEGFRVMDSSLFKGKLLHVQLLQLRNEDNGVTKAPPTEILQTVDDSKFFNVPGVNIVIIIAVIGGICCVSLIFMQLYLRRYYRLRSRSYGQQRNSSLTSMDSMAMGTVNKPSRLTSGHLNPALDITPEHMEVSHPLTLSQLAVFQINLAAIYKEFQSIPNKSPRLSVVPPGAEDKNRFANVLPIPRTRVILEGRGGDAATNYINANFVSGYNGDSRTYIATQAPLERTVTDFWRMVWEQKSRAIVMLMNLSEDGHTKCANYFPDSVGPESATVCGQFSVAMSKREVHQEYIASWLELTFTLTGEARPVRHHWLTCWPTASKPEPISLIRLVLDTRPHYENCGFPLVVHCSNGISRSGTFIALDICMRQLESTPSRTVDVMRCVHSIRQERAGCVQTSEQYALLYNAVNEYASILSSPAVSAASSATTLHAMLP